MAALADDLAPEPTIGELLRSLRTARGWSQASLAAAAGLHPDSVTDLECGRHLPKPETVSALAAALARPAALTPVAVGRRMPGRVPSAIMAGTFGTLLARYRRRAGLSQYALGEVAALNGSSINRYESGERDRPEWRTVDALARALGLTAPETDALLIAAGYAPSWASDRTVIQLAALLDGDAVLAAAVRAQIQALDRMTREGDEQ